MDEHDRLFQGTPAAPPVRTWDVLRSIGFEPDPSTLSDKPGALRIDFGNVVVKAIHGMSPRWVEVVTLSGVLRTPRSILRVCGEMPQVVESREQGIAWLTWCLDSAVGGEFCPSTPASWLGEGRSYSDRLPWERQRLEAERWRAELEACPKCEVLRQWARPAVRSLLRHIAESEVHLDIEIGFNGEVLVMKYAGHVTACPGTGVAWPATYAVPSASFRTLPSRFMSQSVCFSVLRGDLVVDRHRCAGAREVGARGSG